MGKIHATAFVSLDGVMQAPGATDEDPSGGFVHGGWLAPHVDEMFLTRMAQTFENADAFLLGRGTHDIFAAYWPHHDEPKIGRPLNALPKVVASRRDRTSSWTNVAFTKDVVRSAHEMKAKYAREIQVHGSPGLLQTLLREGLVDELRVIQAPIVLGSGKRLFEGGAKAATWGLVRSEATTKGILFNTYRQVGALETRTIEPPTDAS